MCAARWNFILSSICSGGIPLSLPPATLYATQWYFSKDSKVRRLLLFKRLIALRIALRRHFKVHVCTCPLWRLWEWATSFEPSVEIPCPPRNPPCTIFVWRDFKDHGSIPSFGCAPHRWACSAHHLCLARFQRSRQHIINPMPSWPTCCRDL